MTHLKPTHVGSGFLQLKQFIHVSFYVLQRLGEAVQPLLAPLAASQAKLLEIYVRRAQSAAAAAPSAA